MKFSKVIKLTIPDEKRWEEICDLLDKKGNSGAVRQQLAHQPAQQLAHQCRIVSG